MTTWKQIKGGKHECSPSRGVGSAYPNSVWECGECRRRWRFKGLDWVMTWPSALGLWRLYG